MSTKKKYNILQRQAAGYVFFYQIGEYEVRVRGAGLVGKFIYLDVFWHNSKEHKILCSWNAGTNSYDVSKLLSYLFCLLDTIGHSQMMHPNQHKSYVDQVIFTTWLEKSCTPGEPYRIELNYIDLGFVRESTPAPTHRVKRNRQLALQV